MIQTKRRTSIFSQSSPFKIIEERPRNTLEELLQRENEFTTHLQEQSSQCRPAVLDRVQRIQSQRIDFTPDQVQTFQHHTLKQLGVIAE